MGVHPWQQRIFIDTEFTEISKPMLISLGMVAEDGREFYGEIAGIDSKVCNAFVQANVLPLLGKDPSTIFTEEALRNAVKAWMSNFEGLKQKPVICYDHPIDAHLLWMLLGGRAKGWKERLITLKIDPSLRANYFALHGGRHHALHDARANAVACR
jgi:hypothetical protein